MKCRTIKDGNVVFFGSYGLNSDGTAKFVNENKSSYATEQDAVANSLTEKFLVLKGELWYKIDFGLPLFEKIKSKTIIDSYIASVISSTEDVVGIKKFESTIVDKKYTLNTIIETKYGDIYFKL